MKTWLRRLRGAIGIGLVWGAAWFGVGMVMLGLLLVTGKSGADVPFPIGFGALGFLAGVAFSGFLTMTEGRRPFERMSIPRFAAWGAAGGLALATGFTGVVALLDSVAFLRNLIFLAPVFSVAGAVSAAGALALARRGRDRELLEAGEGADGPG